jgi:hypothetical protein
MIVTARQLEELHRDSGRNGRVALRAGTRLSPLAREWVRKTKVDIEYVDATTTRALVPRPELRRVVWWCDGPCAMAKAALMSQESFVNLQQISSSSEAIAVRAIADEVAARRADAGVLLVQSAGAATVHANRLTELRAIVGTSVDSVEIAMRSIKPNVLIVEHGGNTLMNLKTLVARFVRGGGAR